MLILCNYIYRGVGMNQSFAQRIKALRASTELNGESFGKLFNVKKTAVSNWEKGSTPKIETLNNIASYFNVSVDYLLGKSELSGRKEFDKVINVSDLTESQYNVVVKVIEEFAKTNKK